MYYTPTPDYYNDILKHGMQERSEDTLVHYGVKGMKWRKHIKGKAQLLKTKVNRKLRGMTADQISYDNGTYTFKRRDNGKALSTTRPYGNRAYGTHKDTVETIGNEWEKGRQVTRDNLELYNNGYATKANKVAGNNAGIEAGRERARKKKRRESLNVK